MSGALLSLATAARIIDLSHTYFPGMPHHPVHPPFLYGLAKKHGEVVFPGGGSSASEAIALGAHVGTHIDALCHFSCDGHLHGGVSADDVQSYERGVRHRSVDAIAPILRRGVLLDAAAHEGKDVLPDNYPISAALLEDIARKNAVEIRAGDVVLIRTGWARHWPNPGRFLNGLWNPGPNLEAAQWLSAKGIFATGSDTIIYEHSPVPAMPVHIHLLVESGIHILEALNLEELAGEPAREFVFVGAPLRIEGGTGSPLRAFALIERA